MTSTDHNNFDSAIQLLCSTLETVFDEEYYLNQLNEDLGTLRPIEHYVQLGWKSGLDPNEWFSTKAYIDAFPEVNLFDIDPLSHYMWIGKYRAIGETFLALEKRYKNFSIKTVQSKFETSPPKAEQLLCSIEVLQESGLFDATYYVAHYGISIPSSMEPLHHFILYGKRHRLNPNAYFDMHSYLIKYSDIADADIEPLSHYLVQGEKEDRRPSAYFNPHWYSTHIEKGNDANNILGNYLKLGASKFSQGCIEFDPSFYKLQAGLDDIVDPIDHYDTIGFKYDLDPHPSFSTAYYRKTYLKDCPHINPFKHWIFQGRELNYIPHTPKSSMATEIRFNTRPGPMFEEPDYSIVASSISESNILAFYLPQFHRFEENDRWWGTGFVEWTNLARGFPRYKGHYQPRIPRDLGFYDLSHPNIMENQAKLAKSMGIDGFIFYYYWFNKKRLLEKPVENFLANPNVDIKFAIMWANENWTRRWDGSDQEVLISQEYNIEDEMPLLEDFARIMKDDRYINIDGRPLLIIYRPGLIPDTTSTIERWREILNTSFNLNPIIAMVQGFGSEDPREFGLDGAFEFPPHKLLNKARTVDNIELFDPDFVGTVVDYESVIDAALSEPTPPFPLVRTVVPMWDNDARRAFNGTSLKDATPDKYQRWLSNSLEFARRNQFFGKQIVCVNAWNEWAEGAYLEPDVHYGSAYLNATARAKVGHVRLSARHAKNILLVGHDAHNNGAQINLYHIGLVLQRKYGFNVVVILLDGGKMVADYKSCFETYICDSQSLVRTIERLKLRGFEKAITNTVVTGKAIPPLKYAGFYVVSLVHELPRIIKERKLEDRTRILSESSDVIVCASKYVADELYGICKYDLEKLKIKPQGVYKNIKFIENARSSVRTELKIPQSAKIIIGVGYGDLRKGFDIFVATATHFSLEEDIHFLWVGDIQPDLRDWLLPISNNEVKSNIHIVSFTKEINKYLSAAEFYFLPSREDPFPTVMLEALQVGLPLIACKGSGGFEELFEHRRVGCLIDRNPAVAATAIRTMFNDDDYINPIYAEERIKIAIQEYNFDEYVFELARYCGSVTNSISVVVPNFNYEKFLKQRMMSIFVQSTPVREILFFDDASNDDSISVVDEVASEVNRNIIVHVNQTNSGSVFKQWTMAASSAIGDLVWIAEADDACDPEFLSAQQHWFNDPEVDLVFSDSRAIDQTGKLVMNSYKDYYAEGMSGRLATSKVYTGKEFAVECLSVRNLILNVSSVVWRKSALLRALSNVDFDVEKFRLAGDWRLYLEICSKENSKIVYNSEVLNIHRRHSNSVTHSTRMDEQIKEIELIHAYARKAFDLDEDIIKQQEAYISHLSVR